MVWWEKAFRKSEVLTGGLNYADSTTFGMPGNAARVAGASTYTVAGTGAGARAIQVFPVLPLRVPHSSLSASLNPTLRPAD